jgi:hypothetical protein
LPSLGKKAVVLRGISAIPNKGQISLYLVVYANGFKFVESIQRKLKEGDDKGKHIYHRFSFIEFQKPL